MPTPVWSSPACEAPAHHRQRDRGWAGTGRLASTLSRAASRIGNIEARGVRYVNPEDDPSKKTLISPGLRDTGSTSEAGLGDALDRELEPHVADRGSYLGHGSRGPAESGSRAMVTSGAPGVHIIALRTSARRASEAST